MLKLFHSINNKHINNQSFIKSIDDTSFNKEFGHY